MIDLLKSRRSVRRFTSEKLQTSEIEELMKVEWPSSGDLRSVDLVFYENNCPAWSRIVAYSMGQECVSTSAGVFMACGDYWKSAIKYGWDRGIEYTVMEAGIALYHINVKAMAMGLACCFVGGFHKEAMRTLISPPYDPICMLAVGYEEINDNL